MKRQTWNVTTSTLVLSLQLASCTTEPEQLVEVGRWIDDSVPALFIVYYAQQEMPEAQLQERQKPRARQLAGNYPFVTQVTVYDEDWANQLITEEVRRRIINNELPIGSDLLLDESMTIQGGLVYTYYQNGDYDEFIHHDRRERQR